MKILMINSVCGIRSTGRICTDLADVLKENGHECKIAYGRGTVPDKYKSISYRIGSEIDVKSHALKTRIFDAAGFGSSKATLAFVEQIKSYSPDVIHLHNLHGYYLDISILFSFLEKAGIPVIWTLHDCWTFTGHCAHFSVVGCNKWKNGCHHCPQKKEYPSSFLFDRSKMNWKKKKELFTSVDSMTLVTPSIWLAELVKKSFLGKFETRIIPNGVDLQTFQPTGSNFRKQYGLEYKTIILGAATSWGEKKGLTDLIRLSEILDDSYQVLLVGLNKKQLAKLPPKILGLPVAATPKELAEIYTAADVFVNPSKEETMGLTTVEAMACGTPVVVSNLTAVPEVVSEGAGVILEELTPGEIKKGIEKVLKSETDVRERAFVYDKREQYLKYLDLYEKAMSKSHLGHMLRSMDDSKGS